MTEAQLLANAYEYYASNRVEDAHKTSHQLLKTAPLNHEAHQIIAMCEARLKRPDNALLWQRRAIDLAPDQDNYHYNLAVQLQEGQQSELAMLSYQNCLRLNPDNKDALWNYGELLRINEHFALAVTCFEKLLELGAEKYNGIYHRLAVAYNGVGRPKAAARTFERSLAEREDNTELTQWEYSHVLLAEGELRAGWQAYQSRYLIKGPGRIHIHEFAFPRWQGESLKNKILLIHGEQGIGDQIMFAALVPVLVAEGARLILAVDPSLCRIFSQSFPNTNVVPHTLDVPANLETFQTIDYEVPICSLAHFRGPHKLDESVSNSLATGYLSIDRSRQAFFQKRIQLANKQARKTRLTIGLMWSANPAKGVDWGERRSLQKSIPIQQLSKLEAFADDVQFISLQNRDAGAQAAHAPTLDILDFQNQLLDFADTAALAACCDLVICVDTSVAHLAGALNQRAFILLKYHPDWRWLNEGSRSYWYPKARLFRQQEKGKWDTVIEEVKQAIESELASK